MKMIVFDTGPIISLTLNNLLWLLEPLKKQYNGMFVIAPGVEEELVQKPLQTKRFEFEALQTLHYIYNNTVEVVKVEHEKVLQLLEMANSIYSAQGAPLQIVHYGEMAALAVCIEHKAEAFVIDERTTRLLIENPRRLLAIMSKKMHTPITVNKENFKAFASLVKGLRVIRSVELATIAFELNLLEQYLPRFTDAEERLLDAVLWGLKISGCSVSRRDIEKIKKIERV